MASKYTYLNWGLKWRESNPHKNLFNSALEIFKENLFGTELNSFIKSVKLNQKNNSSFLCSNHPHNIHIQILS